MHFVHMMAIISEESVYLLYLSGKVSFSYGMGTVSLFTWEFFLLVPRLFNTWLRE